MINKHVIASTLIWIVGSSISLKVNTLEPYLIERARLSVSINNGKANCHWRHFQQVVEQHCG